MGLTALGMWDLLDPGMEPVSPALQADSLPSAPPGGITIIKSSWLLSLGQIVMQQ